MLDNLYQDLILDHHKHPRCQGEVAEPSAEFTLFNPLCGDEIKVTLKIEEGIVSDIAFTGRGCSISQASASMMGEQCKGKPVAEVQELFGRFFEMMRGECKAEEAEELGDAVALEGVQRFPARIRCALLAWEALNQCLSKNQPSKD